MGGFFIGTGEVLCCGISGFTRFWRYMHKRQAQHAQAGYVVFGVYATARSIFFSSRRRAIARNKTWVLHDIATAQRVFFSSRRCAK